MGAYPGAPTGSPRRQDDAQNADHEAQQRKIEQRLHGRGRAEREVFRGQAQEGRSRNEDHQKNASHARRGYAPYGRLSLIVVRSPCARCRLRARSPVSTRLTEVSAKKKPPCAGAGGRLLHRVANYILALAFSAPDWIFSPPRSTSLPMPSTVLHPYSASTIAATTIPKILLNIVRSRIVS